MGRDNKYRRDGDNRRGKYTGGSRFDRNESERRTSSQKSFGTRNEKFKKGGSGSDDKPSNERDWYSRGNQARSGGYGKNRKDNFGGRYTGDKKFGQERRGKFGSDVGSDSRASDEGRFIKPRGDGRSFN